MKKIILFCFALGLIQQDGFTQCNPAIPNTANVISATQTTGYGGSYMWICSGDTLTSNGGSNTIFLESGAYLMAGGGSNYVYVPPGAKINLSSGVNTIFYVDTVDIINAGGAPIINKCSSIAYDYTNAPTNGCTFTTAINQLDFPNSVSIYPNPGKGLFSVSLSQAALASTAQTIAEVYNVLGERVNIGTLNQVRGDYAFNISSCPAGVYILKITSSDKVITRKIVLEK
jgi:hypothetical protein